MPKSTALSATRVRPVTPSVPTATVLMVVVGVQVDYQISHRRNIFFLRLLLFGVAVRPLC